MERADIPTLIEAVKAEVTTRATKAKEDKSPEFAMLMVGIDAIGGLLIDVRRIADALEYLAKAKADGR